MATKRVHEIAKERGMSSKDVLLKLRAAGMDVTAAAAEVDEAEALRALAANGSSRPATAQPRAAGQAPAAPRGAATAARPGAASTRAGAAAAGGPAVRRPAAAAQGGRPATPADGETQRRSRRVFEPDGPPLQVQPRGRQQGYVPPPPPKPRPRPSAEPAAGTQRPGAQQPRRDEPSASTTAPARPQAGPRIVESPTPAPAPTPRPPTRRAPAPAPAQQAPARPQRQGQRAPQQSRPAAPSGPRPSATPARMPEFPPRRRPQQQQQEAAASAAQQTTAPEAAADTTAPPAPTQGPPAPGTGPKIISVPEPEKRPKRDETQSQPRRPSRGGLGGERAGGGPGRRRVVIDSQAARRGPGAPAGPAQTGPPQRRSKSRRRRRQEVLEEVASPLDQNAMTRTDIVRVRSGSTVRDISEYFGVPVPEIIKKLMGMGEMVTLTQTLSDEAVTILAEEFDKQVEIVGADDEEEQVPEFQDAEEDLVERPPVVTVMGHVDHGKTSLLDAVRETQVAAGEAGGITQHIGAYQVNQDGRSITFLDTPGHEAFTAMRARGAQSTDIAVIVVAANDGVRPQTREAVDHAKAAGVPMVVAVNKIDLEGADPTRVRTEMTQLGLQPSEWGGDTEFVDVSAKTKEGLDDLLETILVVADLLELKANPEARASGVVIESKLDPGRGPVVTVLVQRGSLHVGDAIVAGADWGRVRALTDQTGERLREAVPGQPVEVLGFDGVPDAGDPFRVVENDRTARSAANERAVRLRNEAQARRAGRKISFDELFKGIQEGELKELNLVLKADVSGSLEAFEDEIAKLPQDEVQVNVIRSGVGGINESDVMLAAASDAIILGFNVRPVGDARAAADREGIEIRAYSVIYRAIEDLRDAMEGLLEPEQVEETVGTVEVRQTFRASRIGTIAGSYVTDGRVRRGDHVRVVRDGTVVYDTTIDSLRRFNEDAREVTSGYECGIVLRNFQDIKEGDVLEVYETRAVERELA
jgi:translation initiation factor IF-2